MPTQKEEALIEIGEKQEKAKDAKFTAKTASHSLKNFLRYPYERRPSFNSINNLQAQACAGSQDSHDVSYEQALYQLSKPEQIFSHSKLFKDDVNSSPKYRKNESKCEFMPD